MNPKIWLNRQPLPKLRTTIKKLTTWDNDDFLALANKEFKQIDLDNKQIASLIKILKSEPMKPDPEFYLEKSPLAGIDIKMKPNKLKLADTTHEYLSEGKVKVRYSSLDEAIVGALQIIQDSKACWEETYKSYLENRKLGIYAPAIPDENLSRVSHKAIRSNGLLSKPLPDNAESSKKYWGLQKGDQLQDETGTVFVVTDVRPALDAPPTVIYEKL